MSDDLVERLRGNFPSIPAMRDAAEEIERLRAEMGEAIAERDALRARAERAEGRIADAPVAVVEEAMWCKDDGESVVGQVDLPAGLIGKTVALVVVND